MCVLPVENSTYAAFEAYKEVLETVPLDLSEDNVTWVASKLSGCAIEMINWLLCFGCASEEFIVIFLNIADCRENSSLTWAAYYAMMVCRPIALDKHPGVRPIGIGETLCRAIANLVMRAAGDQAKTAHGIPQLCAGLEDGIEGATHAVVQWQRESIAPAPGDRDDEEQEEGRATGEANNCRRGDEAAVGGAGEG